MAAVAAPPGSEAFLAYNKVDGYVPTLVGNWVEERSLADRTGVHRLPAASEPETLETVVYEDGTMRIKNPASTLPRTLEHDNQYLAAEWLPTNTVVYQPPEQRVGDLVTYKAGVRDAGPRAACQAAELLKLAKQRVPQAPPQERQLDSTYRLAFTKHDTSGIQIGKAQIKTQDGGPVCRDADFLAETRTLPREQADRYVRPQGTLNASQQTATLPGDAPVTIHSEALAKNKYGEDFFGTKRFGPATFGRYANFSKTIGDYSKDPLATNE